MIRWVSQLKIFLYHWKSLWQEILIAFNVLLSLLGNGWLGVKTTRFIEISLVTLNEIIRSTRMTRNCWYLEALGRNHVWLFSRHCACRWASTVRPSDIGTMMTELWNDTCKWQSNYQILPRISRVWVLVRSHAIIMHRGPTGLQQF